MMRNVWMIPIATLLVACGAEESSSPQLLTDVNSYALRGADHTWPGTVEQNVTLVDNKSAANYYVIFDGSGSMESNECTNGERRIDTAKRAIRGFFDALPVDSNVGLIIFDNFGTRDAFSLQPRDSERLKALTDKAIHGGGTPLGATLAYAHEMLTLQGIKQQGYGDYNIVVLTDGEAGDKRAMIKTVNTITQTSPINIHTIGFCLGNQHALNRQGVVNYQPANNAQELIAGLNSVLAEAPSFSTSSFSELDKTGN